MTITSDSHDHMTVFHLSGQFVFSARHAFHSVTNALLQEEQQINGYHIVINLKDVSFMNSAGLAMLKSFIQRAQEVNLRVSLIKPQEPVHKLFELSSLSDLVPILDTIPPY